MDEKTKKSILKILLSAKILSRKQIEEVLLKESSVKSRLIKTKSYPSQRKRFIQPDISIIEIIESMIFPLHGNETSHVSEEIIMKAIADFFALPFMTIDPLKLNSDTVTKIISRPYAIRHHLIPVDLKDNILTVATSNPFDREGIDGIRQSKGHDIRLVIATRTEIMKIITEFFGFKSSLAAAHSELTSPIDLGNLEQYIKLKSISELGATDQHIINAVEYLLHYAYSQRASDIHIEPKRTHSLIRLRIDGILHTVHQVPRSIHPAATSRIKTLARMDIAEKRRPQDGRIKTSFEGKEIELRVSTLPVAFGEKIVIRIFDPSVLIQDISKLGFLDRELQIFKSFISVPHGLILVTGPTGSGKTTTLYSALKVLSTPDVNLTTIEDPIEMIYEEFNQTAVHTQIGLTFASTLRTILRQDPDIIMVGEIRDFDTADNAIQAALTGHLVMSTLHTNDSPSSITRLLDLGVPAFLINSTLVGVVAQRLVRRVCPSCAEWYHLSEEEIKIMGLQGKQAESPMACLGAGCPQCRGTGYMGRIAIFEIMEMSEQIREAIEGKFTPGKIKQIARSEGFRSLRENAVEVLLQGVTTLDEVVRVTGISAN